MLLPLSLLVYDVKQLNGNVGRFSWHSKVLRSLLKTSVGGWDGNLLGGQAGGRMSDRQCIDSFPVFFNHSSWVFHTLNFYLGSF